MVSALVTLRPESVGGILSTFTHISRAALAPD